MMFYKMLSIFCIESLPHSPALSGIIHRSVSTPCDSRVHLQPVQVFMKLKDKLTAALTDEHTWLSMMTWWQNVLPINHHETELISVYKLIEQQSHHNVWICASAGEERSTHWNCRRLWASWGRSLVSFWSPASSLLKLLTPRNPKIQKRKKSSGQPVPSVLSCSVCSLVA